MSTSADRNVNPLGGDQSRSPITMGAEIMLTLTRSQSTASVQDQVAPEEWRQRVALAAAYRLVAHFQ
jgi:hypothetical protein